MHPAPSRMAVTLGVLLCLSLAGPAVAAGPDAAAGARLYLDGDMERGILACASCHGEAGNSDIPLYPNLAAQPHEYLAQQLRNFQIRDGASLPARLGPQGEPTAMTPMAQPLTPEDIANVARYLAEQPLRQPAASTQEDVGGHGQRLWRGGLPARNIPACAACHGPAGAGLPGQYPRLAGQFPAYLEEQLRLLRSGERGVSPVMQDIASRMSDQDIQSVADYAAGLR